MALQNSIRKITGIVITFLFINFLSAQPYIDLVQIRYTQSQANEDSEISSFRHLWIGSDLPIKLKDKSYLVLSPTYEEWNLDSSQINSVSVKSFSFPVGLLLPFRNSKWSLTLLPIVRWNGENMFKENTFQFGGAALLGYENKPSQKFRAGVYVNKEFFGSFIVPLFGVDWRLNDKNYIFGVLPGRITFEHQLNEKFYTGFTFRAPTNSYRLSNGQFVRIDDNQLSIFLDYYLTKHICFTIEPGYGISRKARFGNDDRNYLREFEWKSGAFVKISTAYRIRI
jgi:hypothetical protein